VVRGIGPEIFIVTRSSFIYYRKFGISGISHFYIRISAAVLKLYIISRLELFNKLIFLNERFKFVTRPCAASDTPLV
jgi:hypothetical protein